MQRSSSSPQGSPHFAGTKTSPTWLRLATGQVLCSMHISRLCGETSRLKANKALVEEALVIRTATSVAEPAICTAPLPFRSPANSTRTAKGPAQMLGQEFRHVIDVTPKGCRDLCAKAAEERTGKNCWPGLARIEDVRAPGLLSPTGSQRSASYEPSVLRAGVFAFKQHSVSGCEKRCCAESCYIQPGRTAPPVR